MATNLLISYFENCISPPSRPSCIASCIASTEPLLIENTMGSKMPKIEDHVSATRLIRINLMSNHCNIMYADRK